MPWKASDATSKTRKAAGKGRKWAKIANAVLEKDHDEAKAIRIANAAMKKKRKR